MAETFCLKWNTFEQNISRSFVKLRGESQLYDVTLVGSDQKQVSAHRLVLSASSEFFKNIFNSNTHSNPLLYLDCVDSSEVNLMLDYIYQGEVQIHQEHLERFLEVAGKFQLEGLIGTNDSVKSENLKQYHQIDEMEEEPHLKDDTIKYLSPKPNLKVPKVLQDPTDLIDASNMNVNQMYQELIVKENGKYTCTVCDKSMGHKANMERHVETHMTGLSYDCKNCGETFRSRHQLKHHNNIHT